MRKMCRKEGKNEVFPSLKYNPTVSKYKSVHSELGMVTGPELGTEGIGRNLTQSFPAQSLQASERARHVIKIQWDTAWAWIHYGQSARGVHRR